MFKALDIWMEEFEEELYNDYMRAHDALNDWKSARRATVKDIDTWKIRDSLKGDYRGYCCLYVTSRYREEVITLNGIQWTFLIDKLTIDEKDYEIVVACGKAKGEENTNKNWSEVRSVERKFEDAHSSEFGWNLFLQHRKVYPADIKLVEGKDELWIRARAHKDMIRHKEALEAKIAKICGRIDSVNEESGEYYIKGTNGRIAHIWRIIAGGWNIQRAHSRCLVKEVKN